MLHTVTYSYPILHLQPQTSASNIQYSSTEVTDTDVPVEEMDDRKEEEKQETQQKERVPAGSFFAVGGLQQSEQGHLQQVLK